MGYFGFPGTRKYRRGEQRQPTPTLFALRLPELAAGREPLIAFVEIDRPRIVPYGNAGEVGCCNKFLNRLSVHDWFGETFKTGKRFGRTGVPLVRGVRMSGT